MAASCESCGNINENNGVKYQPKWRRISYGENGGIMWRNNQRNNNGDINSSAINGENVKMYVS